MATQTGEFSQTYVEDLLAPVLKAVVAKAKLDPARYPDDAIGTLMMHTHCLRACDR